MLPRWSSFVPALALLVPVLTSVACEDGEDEEPVLAIRPIVARFETGGQAMPPFLDVPFPSSAYLESLTSHFGAIPNLKRTFKHGDDLLNGQLEAP